MIGILIIHKNIFSVFSQRHIQMHTGTGDAVNRFRHECGMHTVTFSYGSDGQLVGHQTIGCLQRLSIFKINLMLSGGCFMMGSFYLVTHFFQRKNHIPSEIFSRVHGTHIKITGFFVSTYLRSTVLIRLKQEKFQLRSHIKGIAHVCGLFAYLL